MRIDKILQQHIYNKPNFITLTIYLYPVVFIFGLNIHLVVFAMIGGVHENLYSTNIQIKIDYNIAFMLNYKQLYQTNPFELPDPNPIDLNPFPHQSIDITPDLTRDLHIKQLFKGQHRQFQNFVSAYSNGFQQLCAKQNLYPFMIKVGPNKICVICKECMVYSQWSANTKGKKYQGGDELIKCEKWEKIKLVQIPTAVAIGKYGIYMGFQSGKISQYVFRTKGWQGSNQQLDFPVLQMEILNEEQNKQTSLLVLDSAGNIITLTFSHKTFLDKIIKTLSSTKWTSLMFKDRKREKIKRMFKNLLNKDKQQQTQPNSSQTVETNPHYHYNKFSLRKVHEEYLLATFRKNTLELIVLDEKYQLKKNIVVEQDIQEDASEGVWVQLGQGGFQNANTTHQILVLGVAKKINFYRIVEIQDGYQVLKVSEVAVQESIIFGKFVSNNVLLLQDQHSLYLSTIGDKPSELIPLQIHKFSYIDFFIDEQNLQIDKKLIVGNLVDLLAQPQQKQEQKIDRRYLALQGKRLMIGRIYSWRSMLQKLVEQKEWEMALCCFQRIYNNDFKICCGVSQNISTRNEQMKDLCQQIATGYINKYIELLKSQKETIQSACIINSFIYFLLRCQYSHILFNYAQTILDQNDLDGVFIDELSRYIEQTNGYNLKIAYMSEKYLTVIIKKYKENGQDHILQQLLMQFDLAQMQKLLLLGVCLKYELYHSLVSICSEQKDFITPIVKLCGIGVNQKQKQGKIADIIYWYLNQCLSGRMTDYGNQNEYLNMLAILINFMFIPSSLQMLLTANHIYLMQVIYMFFDPKIMRYILQNQPMFFMRKDITEQILFQDSCLSEFKLYEKMLGTLVLVVEGSGQNVRNGYEGELNRLLINLMLRNNFPFLSRLKIKIIKYFINHPLLFVGGDELNEDKQIQVNGQLMRLLDSLIRSINEKCLTLRQRARDDASTVLEIEELMKQEKEREMNGILELIMLSDFSEQFAETKCYIYHELGRYATVLELYLKMVNRKVRVKVFLYLQNNLHEYSELTRQFLKYMLSFVRIDKNRTVKLLWQVKPGWADHQQIIDELVDYSDIQLGYIERVMKQGKEKSKKLLLRHLDIVLRQHGEEIDKFIGNIQYPLEQAFKMCEERNNRMGKACILIKSGRNMEGVMIISQIFLESVRQYLPIIRKAGVVEQQRKAKIMSQLKAVLQTCHKEWIIDNDRGQDIWQKNTQIIFKKLAVSNIDTPHVPEIIRTFLNEIITRILSCMLEEVSPQFFLDRFVRTFGNLPLRIFVEAYSYINNRLEFTYRLQKLHKDMLQQNEIRSWTKIMNSIVPLPQKQYKAHVCQTTCHVCNHPLTTNERMITFTCNHVMHQQCYYEQNIKKNRNQLCPLCFSSLQSILMFGQPKQGNKPLRYRVEVDELELLRSKMNKMTYYDRTAQISGMEHWGQVDEWVDL